MATPPSPRQVAQLLETLASTERWLDEHVGRQPLSPEVRRLAFSLRQYVRRCRRWVAAGKMTDVAVDRRRWKVLDAGITIWKKASGVDR